VKNQELSTDDFSGLQKLAEARGNIYKLLSQIYLYEPSKELIKGLCEAKFLCYLSNVSSEYLQACKILEDFLKTLKGNGEYKSVRQEYMNLFVVPSRQYVRPYESVYRDKQFGSDKASGLVMGESTTAVKRFYTQAGVKISPIYTNLPDHFGLELQFMHLLCMRESEAWKQREKDKSFQYLELQRLFLKDHLAQWSNEVCTEIVRLAKRDFYKAIAEITKRYVAQDCAEVDLLIRETNKNN
jgi:TorA maturation chaperone TorD